MDSYNGQVMNADVDDLNHVVGKGLADLVVALQ